MKHNSAKSLFLALLTEMHQDTPVYQEFTAQQMIENMERDSKDSQNYMNSFLKIVAAMLGAKEVERNLDYNTVTARVMFTDILKELSPDKVVWKTMSGNFTAQQLLDSFDDLGQEFASSIFRVARDVLSRQSKKVDY